MSEWREYRLCEVYDFSSGLSKPAKEFGFGSPFLSFKEVFYNYYMTESPKELVNSTPKEQESCSIRRGDVFLTRTSETMHELGMSCVALCDVRNGTFNGFCKRLRPNGNIEVVPEYATYYFRSPKFRTAVTAMSSPSTRASLNNEMLSKLAIVVPEKSIQIAIGNILKSLDDRIELNRKMNETLEEMARAIFKSWFVDFDPVHAKARGEKPAGIPDEIADLFPCEFVHSDQLNKSIPKGWEVKPLGEVFESFGGGTPSTKEPEYWVNGIYYWVTPKDLSNLNVPIIFTTDRKLTEKGLNKVSSGLLPQGTVLLSSRAPIGYIAISEIPIAINQGFIAIKENEFFSKYFIYFWCKENKELIIANANGSTFLEISKKNFRNINSVFPVDEKIISAFTSIVEPIFQLIQKNIIEKNTLTELRDSLLPKLISGEIEV